MVGLLQVHNGLHMFKPSAVPILRSACSFLLIMSIGCATILTGAGKSQSVRVASDPRGAKVYVDGAAIGVTPAAAYLTRHDDHTVKIVLNGYRDETIHIKTGKNWWVLGNLIPFCGGLVGIVIDFADGSCSGRLSPSDINVALVPTTQP
jgi:PEGA domain